MHPAGGGEGRLRERGAQLGEQRAQFMTIGVLVAKSEKKFDKGGRPFCLWKLSGLARGDEEYYVPFLMYEGAVADAWKHPLGNVYLMVNPSVLPPRATLMARTGGERCGWQEYDAVHTLWVDAAIGALVGAAVARAHVEAAAAEEVGPVERCDGVAEPREREDEGAAAGGGVDVRRVLVLKVGAQLDEEEGGGECDLEAEHPHDELGRRAVDALVRAPEPRR